MANYHASLYGSILFIFMMLIESPTFSQQSSFTAQTQVAYDQSAGWRQNLNGYYYNQDSNGVVFYSFGLVTKSWAELRFGVGYGRQFGNFGYFESGLSIGLETNEIPIRGDAYLFWLAYNKNWKALVDIERGGSGWWHLVHFQHQVANNFWIGFRAQKFWVTGAMVAWKIPKTNLTWWGAGGYAPQSEGRPVAAMTGLSLRLSSH